MLLSDKPVYNFEFSKGYKGTALCKTKDQKPTLGGSCSNGSNQIISRDHCPLETSESKFKKSPMIPEMKGHSSLQWGIWKHSHMRWVLTVHKKHRPTVQETTPSAIHLKANKEFNKLLILLKKI